MRARRRAAERGRVCACVCVWQVCVCGGRCLGRDGKKGNMCGRAWEEVEMDVRDIHERVREGPITLRSALRPSAARSRVPAAVSVCLARVRGRLREVLCLRRS